MVWGHSHNQPNTSLCICGMCPGDKVTAKNYIRALVATEWSGFFAASVILVSGHKQLQIALVRVCLHWHVTGHRTNSGKGIS